MKRRRVPARLVFRFAVAEQLCADHDKHDHTVPAVSRCPADDRVAGTAGRTMEQAEFRRF